MAEPPALQKPPVSPPPPPFTLSSKKGAARSWRHSNTYDALVVTLNASWLYGWSFKPLPASTINSLSVHNTEYVPLAYDRGSLTGANIQHWQSEIAHGRIHHILGFNEPDLLIAGDPKISVEDALDAWPQLEGLNVPIGSPATIHPSKSWMVDFMKGVDERNLRVDFVAVHMYEERSNDPESFITQVWDAYINFGRRPLWITEFAVRRGTLRSNDCSQNPHDPYDIVEWMRYVLPRLNALQIVHRFAWFDVHVATMNANNRTARTCTAKLSSDDGTSVTYPVGRYYSQLEQIPALDAACARKNTSTCENKTSDTCEFYAIKTYNDSMACAYNATLGCRPVDSVACA